MTDQQEVAPDGVSVDVSTVPASMPAVVPASTPSVPEKILALAARKKDAKDRTPEEVAALKAYNNAAAAKSKPKLKEKKVAASYVYDSSTEPTKAEAKKILEGRGLKHTHVIDVVYKLLTRAAEEHPIPANRFLYQNGLVQALASYEKKEAQPLLPIPAEQAVGELITLAELHALYDAALAAHEAITFGQYLETRLRCKKDCWYLGKEILDKDFSECHRFWTEFFPQFDPTTLPPNFTQKQAIKWLADHSADIKTFMLLASRSAFKSSWSHIWILSLILCQPSIRLLLISETKFLSKDFISVIRSYFESTPGQETRFHRYFPEFTIPTGDGSVLSLEVPMRHLKLAQPTAVSTSMDSAVAGNRCDIALFDDCISSTSCNNDVQIQASINKFLALGKLVEVGGFKLVLGTPWAFNDLYSYIIEMSEAEDSGIAVRIDPAFRVKPQAKHKLTPQLLSMLREDEIESFLFPERLNWKFLRREIGTTVESAAFFLSQNLVMFPTAEDEGIKVSFTEDEIRARIKHPGFFETAAGMSQIVMSLDRAFSTSRYADYSCLAAGKIFQRDNRTVCGVLDVKLERWKESELVEQSVSMIAKHNPVAFVLEKDKGHENLVDTIRKTLLMRGIPVPRFIAKDIPAGGKNLGSKAKRIKQLELPISDGRLWFLSSALWNDTLIQQFTIFDGKTKSNSSRKDDVPDCVSLLYETFMPRQMSAADTPPSDQQRIDKEVEEENRRIRMQQHHDRMFTDGASSWTTASQYNNRNDPPPDPAPRQLTPREQATANLMKVLPSGMRRRNF